MKIKENEIAHLTAGNEAAISRIRDENEREWFATVLELPANKLITVQRQLESQAGTIEERLRFVRALLSPCDEVAA